MRRSLTTVFGVVALGFALLNGSISLVGLLGLSARPDIPPDRWTQILLALSLSLTGKAAPFLSGVLLLLRSRYAGKSLLATLLINLSHAVWMQATLPAPADPSAAFNWGRAVGRVMGLWFIPTYCAIAIAYLRMPKTRAEFASPSDGDERANLKI